MRRRDRDRLAARQAEINDPVLRAAALAGGCIDEEMCRYSRNRLARCFADDGPCVDFYERVVEAVKKAMAR